jgi:hypothetical protein
MKPFGSMPADRELAAFACGFGGLLVGALFPEMVSVGMGRTSAVGVTQRPWWFVALLAAVALAASVQVTGWVLRGALIAFAFARVISISVVASVLSVGALAITAVNSVFAFALLIAAWRQGGPARKGRRGCSVCVSSGNYVLVERFGGKFVWLKRGSPPNRRCSRRAAWRPEMIRHKLGAARG